MSTQLTIYEGANSHVVEVLGLVDGDGNLQSDATVTLVTITDVKTGTEVSGITFPVLLGNVSGGDYRAVLPYNAGFVASHSYQADLTAVGSQDYRAEWTEKLIAKVRRA